MFKLIIVIAVFWFVANPYVFSNQIVAQWPRSLPAVPVGRAGVGSRPGSQRAQQAGAGQNVRSIDSIRAPERTRPSFHCVSGYARSPSSSSLMDRSTAEGSWGSPFPGLAEIVEPPAEMESDSPQARSPRRKTSAGELAKLVDASRVVHGGGLNGCLAGPVAAWLPGYLGDKS